MAVAIRAAARPGVPTAVNTLSAGYGGRLTLSIAGISIPDQVFIVVGVDNPGPPATYADLRSVKGIPLTSSQTALNLSYDPDAGEYTAGMAVELASDDISDSDHVYVAVFTGTGETPGPTDVPDVVAGPFAATR